MGKNRNDLRAGAFILVSAALIVAIALMIRGLLGPTDLRSVRFELADDVGGLRVGDDVRVGGFKVGEVTSILIHPPEKVDGQPYIEVGYSFPKSYIVHEDAVLRIQGTLTGLSWLNFDSLGNGKVLAIDSRGFHGQRSSTAELLADLSDMRPSLRQSVDNVRDITQNVKDQTLPKANATLDQIHQEIPPAFEKYHAVAKSAIGMLDKIAAFFGDTAPDFRGTVANVKKLTGTFNEKLPGILDHVDDLMTHVNASVTNASQALEDVKTTLANAKEISAVAKGVLVRNRGKLDSMIASLKAAGDNLKNATSEIRRSPWRLLYKPNAGEMANLDLYDAARQFSEGATEMNDAASSLRDALQDKDLSQEQLQKLMEKLDKSFENFNQVEKTLWEKVKE